MAECIPSILYAPTFCIHVNQAILHKDIRCQITLNDLVMNKPAFFKHNQAGTCIHHPHKSSKVWPYTFLLHLSKQLMCVLPLPTFHMSQYHCGPSDHISRWYLIKHSPIVLKTPTFCICVHHATPTKTSDLQPLQMICSRTFLPSSRATTLAHTFSTPEK